MTLFDVLAFYGFPISNLLVVTFISATIARGIGSRFVKPQALGSEPVSPRWPFIAIGLIAFLYLGLPGLVILRDQEPGHFLFWFSRATRSWMHHTLGKNLVVCMSWLYLTCGGCALIGLGYATRSRWVGAATVASYLLGFVLLARIFYEMWGPIAYAASIPIASTLLATLITTRGTTIGRANEIQVGAPRYARWQLWTLPGAVVLAFSFPCLSLYLRLMGHGSSPVDAPIAVIQHSIGADQFLLLNWIILILSTSFMVAIPFMSYRFRTGLLMITVALAAIELNLRLTFMLWAVTRPGF